MCEAAGKNEHDMAAVVPTPVCTGCTADFLTVVRRVGSDPLVRTVVLTEVGNYMEVPVLDVTDYRNISEPMPNGSTMNHEGRSLGSGSGAGWMAVARVIKGAPQCR